MARSLRYLCWLIAALGLADLAVAIAGRLGSHWPLEWMEGASLEHAVRLLHGQSIYAAPSGEFIPFIYPPLSYLPMALSIQLFGPQLWAARLPSVLAIAVALFALARAATRLHGDMIAGFLAIGLFGLGYGYSGGFLDLARVDALFVALVLVATERLTAGKAASGLAFAVLACFAKQHGVLFLIAASVALVWPPRVDPSVDPVAETAPEVPDGRGRQLERIAVAWACLGLGCLALNYVSHGWFWTYTMLVPARHGVVPWLLLSFVLVDLGMYLPVLSGFGVLAILQRVQQHRIRACDWLLLAGIAASALGRAHPGGDDNVRLPAYVLLVLVSSVAFCDSAAAVITRKRQLWLGVACLWQVLMLGQLPTLYWPSPAAISGIASLQHELERCAGGQASVAFDHTRLTGHAFVHTQALSDLRANHDALGTQATRAVVASVNADDSPTAIALSLSFGPLQRALDARYVLCAELPALRLPTGYAIGETQVYRRRMR